MSERLLRECVCVFVCLYECLMVGRGQREKYRVYRDIAITSIKWMNVAWMLNALCEWMILVSYVTIYIAKEWVIAEIMNEEYRVIVRVAWGKGGSRAPQAKQWPVGLVNLVNPSTSQEGRWRRAGGEKKEREESKMQGRSCNLIKWINWRISEQPPFSLFLCMHECTIKCRKARKCPGQAP